jgi:hypothetical protein
MSRDGDEREKGSDGSSFSFPILVSSIPVRFFLLVLGFFCHEGRRGENEHWGWGHTVTWAVLLPLG